MRIVYLHQYFVTPEMAGGVRSYEMARRLAARGHDVHVVTADQESRGASDGWRESVECGVNVHWTPVPYDNTMSHARRLRAFFTFAWSASRRASALRPDLVFATSTPLTIALPAVYAARRNGCPMVFEVRDLWPEVPIAIGALRNPATIAVARWLERFAYGNAAHVVALTPGMKDHVVSVGCPADRVSVIPNGCDLELFGADASAPNLREQFGWIGNRPLLVFCGTFGLVNGVDYLPRLCSHLLVIDPGICVVALGHGREFEAVRRLAAQLAVLERNFFMLGRVPKKEAAAWVRTAQMTIALFTGPEIVWRDAVQNKFFDSLAAGRPVANNFPGWQAKIAVEAGAGLILDAHDTCSAARTLAKHLRDAKWLEAASRAASDLARTRFDRDFLAADLARVLEGVVRAHGTPARLERAP